MFLSSQCFCFDWTLCYLWELGKTRVSKQRNVSQELVADIAAWEIKRKRFNITDRRIFPSVISKCGHSRLRCVCGLGAVTDVLRGMKHSEGESSQEVPGWQEAGHRTKPETCARCRKKGWKVLMRRGRKWGVWTGPAAGETSPRCFWSQMNDKTFHLQHNTAGLTLQEAGHVLQLWDVVRPVAAVFLQQGEDAVVFAAGVSRVQSLQLLEHFAPCHPFSLCVLHPRDDLATGIKIQGWCVSLCLKCISRKLLSLTVHLYVATVDHFSPSSC